MTMVFHSPESSAPNQQQGQSTDYAHLLTEARREAEPVPLAAYEQLAQQIGDAQKYAVKAKMSPGEIINELHGVFGDQDDSRLARFAAVAIDAPKMSAFQGSVDRSKGASLSPQDATKLRARLFNLCEYNDDVRHMLIEGRETFNRPGITRLLDGATNDQVNRFLHQELTGMIGEITLGDTLQKLPGITDFAYTEPEIDFTQGIDMVMRYHGQTVAVDAKAGDFNQAKTDRVKFQNSIIPRVTMNVPTDCVGDIGPTERGQAELARRAELLMVTAGLNPRNR